MSQSDITTKAKELLKRRGAPNSPWFYFFRDWRRESMFLAAYIAIPTVMWYLVSQLLAVAMACFFAGTKIRDVRWWFALSKQWPTTSELLDWAKIEALASGASDG